MGFLGALKGAVGLGGGPAGAVGGALGGPKAMLGGGAPSAPGSLAAPDARGLALAKSNVGGQLGKKFAAKRSMRGGRR